ncbi:MAG: hypothetical protein ACRESZ_03385, partial [Methylococcales bacterium]
MAASEMFRICRINRFDIDICAKKQTEYTFSRATLKRRESRALHDIRGKIPSGFEYRKLPGVKFDLIRTELRSPVHE